MRKFIIGILFAGLLGLTVGLTGCAQKMPDQPKVEIAYQTRYIEKPKPILPEIKPVKVYEPYWYVLNKGETDDVFERAGAESLLAITHKDYERLSVNQVKLREAMRQYILHKDYILNYYDDGTPATRTGKDGEISIKEGHNLSSGLNRIKCDPDLHYEGFDCEGGYVKQ